MFNLNEYFGGNVKSLGFETPEGKATIGVLAIGEYEFGTSMTEYMTVTSGRLIVKLPGSDQWKEFKTNDKFKVEANKKFQLKINEVSTYLCEYRDK
jgi:purine/pyrimidine-nucleoside phosphorylase